MKSSEFDKLDGQSVQAPVQSYDPICGVRLCAEDHSPSSEYKKRRYFFCSNKCKAEFDKAAERIRMHEAAKAGALFTLGKVRWGLA